MSYCFNPSCQNPQNIGQAKVCIACGANLLLKERYRLLKPIAQGGFGRTFLSTDDTQPTKPRCVVKQFLPQPQNADSAATAAALFRKEAARLSQLGSHPQIPQLLDYIEQNQQQYVIQEFIDGLQLAQELAQTGAFQEQRIRQLLLQLLPVLDFIHSHQVIHRDIKPENIIARPHGPFVLVDFGAAKFATGTLLTRTGTLIGSASYAAPEQAAGKATFASDIYSLGVTCLHLLTHISPFDLFDLAEGAWAWRDYLTQPISDELGHLLDKMVEPATNRRYNSAAAALAGIKGNASKSASFPTPSAASIRQRQSPSTPIGLERYFSVKKRGEPKAQPALKWSCLRTLEGHTKPVHAVNMSPDGQVIASASEDGILKLWNAVDGKIIRTLGDRSTGSCDAVAFSADGELIAGAGYDGAIRLWRVGTGTPSATLKGHHRYVSDLAFSPDGQWLASASYDNTLRIWNVAFNQRLFLWQIVNAKPVHMLPNIHGGWVCAIAWSPDAQKIASVGEDGTVKLWNAVKGELIQTFKEHEGMTQAVAFSPNGQFLASSGKDKTIRIWKIANSTVAHTLPLQSEANALSFSRNGQVLVSGQTDCNLHVWQTTNGQNLGMLSGHSKLVSAVAFSPDGQSLVSGSEDKTVKVWTLKV
jgi:WD40 repeat protein